MKRVARGAETSMAGARNVRATGIVATMTIAAATIAGAARATPPATENRDRARPLRVGSKTFTESVILGEIAAQLARGTGRDIEHVSGLGGTRLVWNALIRGAIDMYPEYTGTLAQEILGDQMGIAGSAATRTGPQISVAAALVAALASKGIGVIGPLGFNNTYAIGVAEELARRLALTNVSDLSSHPELRFGFSSEFLSRRDGWPALRERYALPQIDVKGLDHDLAYRGLASGAIDATDLYATDADIRRLSLRVLVDDRQVFPRYDAVLLYRLELDARASDVIAVLGRLRNRIDASTMTAMNARAKIERVPERDVASEFLQSTFGLAAHRAPRGVARSILGHAREHLSLVALSLLAAIAVAVPLGILAARKPRAGQLILGAVGIVQTVPALALLVFMIPLVGIGAVPAMVALFLYSLLPIVRNTHAGLQNISPALRESAEALGLPPGAILRLIHIPLASPLILAGIKSAAVINVGTATLGALIGAGGFGQPIFTGIRLDDVGLILEGAIPASVMALLMQGCCELFERWAVPKGLRLRVT